MRRATVTLAAVALSGCAMAEYGTHSLGTTPLIVPGGNSEPDGRPSPSYFQEQRRGEKTCCKARAECMRPDLITSTAMSSTICDLDANYAREQAWGEVKEICRPPRKILINTRDIKCIPESEL